MTLYCPALGPGFCSEKGSVTTMSCAAMLVLSLVGQLGPPLEFPPLKPYRHSCPIRTSYDRFADESIYSVELGRLVPKEGPTLIFSAHQHFRGRDRKATTSGTKVYLKLEYVRRTSREVSYERFVVASYEGGHWTPDAQKKESGDVCEAFAPESYSKPAWKSHAVFFVFEKGRIEDPPSVLSVDHKNRTLWLYYQVTVQTTIEEFLNLANSEWIDCRLGVLEFRLTAEQRTALRDFAARMAFDEATLKLNLGQVQIDNEAKRPKNNGRPVAPNPEKPDAKKRATEAESLLRVARELENSDNASGAIICYKEIVEKFADSPQARTARERLRVLQGPPGEK